MKEDDLLEIAKANRLMRSPDEVTAFDLALAELAKNPKKGILVDLFMLFDDRCEDYEVMWGLLHFVESFDEGEYFQALSKTLPFLETHAAEWAKILHCRILNHPELRVRYKEFLSSIEEVEREPVYRILEEIVALKQPPLSTHAKDMLDS